MPSNVSVLIVVPRSVDCIGLDLLRFAVEHQVVAAGVNRHSPLACCTTLMLIRFESWSEPARADRSGRRPGCSDCRPRFGDLRVEVGDLVDQRVDVAGAAGDLLIEIVRVLLTPAGPAC